MATRCLALALAPEIRVNAVAPGILDPPGADEAFRDRVPLATFRAPRRGRRGGAVPGGRRAPTRRATIVPVDGGRGLA